MSEEIINRVATSQLITIDLQELLPDGERAEFDLKEVLYESLILREKEFRSFIKEKDWSVFKDKHVAVHCSADAIVPKWAYMLLATKISPFAKTIVHGNLDHLEDELLLRSIRNINPSTYQDKKIVVKGCGDKQISEAAYMEISAILQPVVASIMYGEPCSTVPVFKRLRKA